MNELKTHLSGGLTATYPSNLGLRFYKIVHKFLALIVIAWMNNGIFAYAMPYFPNVLRWGIFFIWFCFAIISTKSFFTKFLVQTWPLLIFYFYLLLIFFFNQADYIAVYLKNFLYLIMVYSIFLYYFNNKYKRFKKVLIALLLFDCLYLAINTYVNLQKNPLLARYLATGDSTREQILGSANLYTGVGSYGFFTL